MLKHIARKKERKICRIFEKFITEGNKKADELAKGGALQDTGFMAEARPETMQQEMEELYAALQYAARFHCLVEEWTDREKSWFGAESVRDMRGKEWTETDERLQAGADGHPKRMATCWMLKRLQVLEDGGVATKEARSWRIEGPKRRITRMEYQRLLNKFEMEGCMAPKMYWAISLERRCCRTGE